MYKIKFKKQCPVTKDRIEIANYIQTCTKGLQSPQWKTKMTTQPHAFIEYCEFYSVLYIKIVHTGDNLNQ